MRAREEVEVRVIAGIAKGRTLVAPKGRQVRPTTDRVRQSMMDILAGWTAERDWLDLFAGSGSVGIEALSRGARRVVFVEQDRRALEALLANLRRTGLEAGAEVRHQPVERALVDLADGGGRFDVIFADPPYEQGLVEATVRRVVASGIVREGGLLVVQHSAREQPLPPAGWRIRRQVPFGETQVTILTAADEEGDR
ncbi:16S rRNA (guanine(966)-N(2))-methyltransferase RsmD [Geochorda subterranea]|uniref:16S rRNA (Guanine(966)-N(2))-methyltransferase RsmD n=1 Tax=Geochorda subterranea TaxID=3109564 RepID=A0ABZ1BKK6_9FIRM|nr:16S rRNA (guanine(966)-N(2))-methyltransferase RsmD [Limnochorda sp. LNt]WRP13377.1 16S rRNA (guanine(966)-N(2))-methyltransferase RsmD [Limnochorda sp. LNt]